MIRFPERFHASGRPEGVALEVNYCESDARSHEAERQRREHAGLGMRVPRFDFTALAAVLR